MELIDDLFRGAKRIGLLFSSRAADISCAPVDDHRRMNEADERHAAPGHIQGERARSDDFRVRHMVLDYMRTMFERIFKREDMFAKKGSGETGWQCVSETASKNKSGPM